MSDHGVPKTPSSSAKKNRNTYTIKEKIAIRRYKQAGSSSIQENPVSLSEIRTWFTDTFNKEISLSSIRDIISPKWDMLDNELSPLLLKAKTIKRPVWPVLEAALNEWIMYAGKSFNIDPSKDNPDQSDFNVIRQKADFLFTKLSNSETSVLNPEWKDDWCRRFYDNWKFFHHQNLTESEVDTFNHNENTFADIRELYRRYPLQDRFACDKMMIRPGTLPGKCFWTRSVSQKQIDTVLSLKISALVCCNADGSEKLPLLSIMSGNATNVKSTSTLEILKSRKNINNPIDLELDHVVRFLHHFDSLMSFRKVALLLNNNYIFKKAVEKIKSSDDPLINVEVFWIPIKNSHDAQPLKHDVLSAIKEGIRYRYLKELKSCYEMNENPLLKLVNNTHIFFKWLDESWKKVSCKLITKSFDKVGLGLEAGISCLITSKCLPQQRKDCHELCEKLLQYLIHKKAIRDPIVLHEYLDPTDEKKAAEQEDEEEVLVQIVESYRLHSLLKSEQDKLATEKKACELKELQKEALKACQKLSFCLSNISGVDDLSFSLKNEMSQLMMKWEDLQTTLALTTEAKIKLENI